MTVEGAPAAAGRLDAVLVARGLARSRAVAAEAVAAGRVRVDGRVARRPAERVGEDADLLVEEPDTRYGRAGQKLEAALDAFAVPVAGRAALDLGASTGGFTQVLLDRGAASVVALDVGHGQLVAALRQDPRVVVVERENARDLAPDRLRDLGGPPGGPDLVVADLSFISLTLVLPAVAAVVPAGADVVCLVKPQFEAGRGRVREGLVMDPAVRAGTITDVVVAAGAAGLALRGVIASPVVGRAGNREALIHLQPGEPVDPAQWTDRIAAASGDARGTETA